MRKLMVYYDETCAFCRFWRDWIDRQPKYVAVDLVPREEAKGIAASDADELIAVDDAGGVYRGDKAFIIVLYALREWRDLSLRLASPLWRGIARRVFQLVSQNRYRLSLVMSHDDRLAGIREHEKRVCALPPKPVECEANRCRP